MALTTSANVQPQGKAEPMSASYDVDTQRITLGDKAQELCSWWPEGKKTKELDDARAGRLEFRQWLEDNIDKKDLKAISETASSKEILDSLDEQTFENLTEVVECFYAAEKLEQAGRAASDLRIKRSKGVRKATTRFVKFAKSFQEFLTVYSGIVDIMKSASNQYGGLAYGALSLLFSVAASKQGMETALQSAIEDLKTRIEEMAIYRRVYPDPSLGALVAKVFKGIVDFSRSAIKYYKNHGILRSMRAAGNPHAFDDSVVKIKSLMTAVQTKCEALLAERCERIEGASNRILDNSKVLKNELTQVKKQNLSLQLQIQHLKEQLCQMSATKDSEHVTEILRCLQMQGYTAYNEDEHHKQIEEYRFHLREFTEDHHRTRMDLKTLRETQQYSNWIRSKHSSILAISGRNERGISESRGMCCWLSPAALDLIEEALQSGRCVLYHLNVTHQYQREYKTAHDIFISLTAQLLTKHPKLLRDPADFSRLQSKVRRLDPKEDLEEVRDFMIGILNLCGEETSVEMILDRIDVYSGSVAEAELMNALLRIIRSVKCTLKILVVAANWDLTRESRFLDARKLDDGMFVKLVRDQELQGFY